MKKLINTLLGTVMVLGLNVASGQDFPQLRSKDALRTYALEQLAQASAQINSALPVGNNNYQYVPVQSPTTAGLSNTIRDISLSVDVANPNDPLYVWASGNSSDGDTLFSGYNQFNLVLGKAGYILPEGYGNVTLTMVDNVPIKIAGATSAFVDILGPDGKSQQQYSLNVYNGKVYFPRQLTGTNAILSVFIGGKGGVAGHWAYWNVSTGSSIQTEHFNVSLNPTVQGIVSIANTNQIIVSVPTTNGIGFNLTAEYASTAKQWVNVSFKTTEGKYFKGVWVRKARTSDWVAYATGAGLPYVPVPFDTGIYYVVPVWNDGDLVEPADPYYPPTYPVGKG